MATYAGNFAFNHSSDANFRLWGLEVNARLAAVGLVQTADTGQINWASVARPGTNTQAGYEIWRFNDSLQGSSPIFLRIGYGTGNNAGRMGMWLSVGTGTNGAGTLTGLFTSAFVCHAGTGTQTGTSVLSAYCHAEGFAGAVIGWGAAAASYAALGWAVARTVNSDGTPNGNGCLIIRHSNATGNTSALVQTQTLRFEATSAFYLNSTGNAGCGFLPGAEGTAVVGGDTEVMVSFGVFPDTRPVPGIAHAFLADVPENTTVSVALIGSTSRTYLSVGRQMGRGASSNATTDPTLLLTWQ